MTSIMKSFVIILNMPLSIAAQANYPARQKN